MPIDLTERPRPSFTGGVIDESLTIIMSNDPTKLPNPFDKELRFPVSQMSLVGPLYRQDGLVTIRIDDLNGGQYRSPVLYLREHPDDWRALAHKILEWMDEVDDSS